MLPKATYTDAQLAEMLTKAGIRLSAQRIAVFAIVANGSTHPTADEIFSELSERYPLCRAPPSTILCTRSLTPDLFANWKSKAQICATTWCLNNSTATSCVVNVDASTTSQCRPTSKIL